MKIMYCRKDFSSMTSTTVLDKFVPSPHPLSPPNQGRENGAFWLLLDFILDLGRGDGSLLFHFILSKIVAHSAAGITVLFLRIVGRTRQRTGHDFYPLTIFHLFGFPSWKSCDPKILGIKTYLFKNFSQKKCSQKF